MENSFGEGTGDWGLGIGDREENIGCMAGDTLGKVMMKMMG
jgi:hypothetical protein